MVITSSSAWFATVALMLPALLYRAVMGATMAVSNVPSVREKDFSLRCAVCSRELNLSEATIGINDANGDPVFTHEAHRTDRITWLLFWLRLTRSERDKARRRLGLFATTEAL